MSMRCWQLPCLLGLVAAASACPREPGRATQLERRGARPERQQLLVTGPSSATVFEEVELGITMPAILSALPADDLHDAYDADRDGKYLRLSAVFKHSSGGRVEVPGFAARLRPGGPFGWRVRWSPRRAGRFRVKVELVAGLGRAHPTLRLSAQMPGEITARVDPRVSGPLVAPDPGQSSRYLRRLRTDGSSEAIWLFGACRAWVISPAARPGQLTGWAGHSPIDRSTELLEPMRRAGLNLLNQWMAPWEYLLVHHDRAEHWRAADGTWRRRVLAPGQAWAPHRAYDQGRALAFDRLMRQCEGDPSTPAIYLLLAPLPHQSLQMRQHPWGADESGWSPADDGGRQAASKLNGFSGFRAGMTAWQLFEASPKRPLSDWRSRLFDHQANFFRYLIARWGHSRALGAWVLVDELDAVGDELGNRGQRKGWWAHPQCDRWLADITRMFRGQLVRADGLRYAGDPFRHPIHAATTSSDGRLDSGGNIGWPGGPAEARPDLIGWHWYPDLPARPTPKAWLEVLDGVDAFAHVPAGQRARLISEFGAPDRQEPTDVPSLHYPTLFHIAIWASIFSGQAGTAMDWDDGKEFGELRFRDRPGAFERQRYPIDHTAQIRALRAFLHGLQPDTLAPCPPGRLGLVRSSSPGARLFALCGREEQAIHGWLFASRGRARIKVRVQPGTSLVTVRWVDPWSGRAVMTQRRPIRGEILVLDATPLLARLRKAAKSRAPRLRLGQGRDLAFRLVPLPMAEITR